MPNNHSYLSNTSSIMLRLKDKAPLIEKIFEYFIKLFLYMSDSIYLLFHRKKNNSQPESNEIAFIFLSHLGDIVVWLDIIKEFRKQYPKNEYHFTIVCQNAFVDFFKEQQIFEHVIGISVDQFIQNLKYRYQTISNLRNNYYRTVYGSLGITTFLGTDSMLIHSMWAESRRTFYETKNYATLKKIPFLTRNIFHEIKRIDNKKFPRITEVHADFYNQLFMKKYQPGLPIIQLSSHERLIKQKYCLVFPFCSDYRRLWPIDRYIALTKKIYAKTKLPIVIIGTSHDLRVANEFIAGLKDIPIMNYLGKTSVLEMIRIIRDSEFAITNDTGTYHLAIGTHTPVAVIAPGGHFERFIAYGQNNAFPTRTIIANCPNNCCDFKCNRKKQMANIWPCLNDISVNDAWKKINKMIERR